ncbi:unnamed protein product [Linum trigynum]|uniref:Uncharacterized protein n=1 Tax=Linum trigynum TaxID=586398 RepID=A0AAV2CBH6_9ROSI
MLRLYQGSIVVPNVEFHRHHGGSGSRRARSPGAVTRRSDVKRQAVACFGTAVVVDGEGESGGEVGDGAGRGFPQPQRFRVPSLPLGEVTQPGPLNPNRRRGRRFRKAPSRRRCKTRTLPGRLAIRRS